MAALRARAGPGAAASGLIRRGAYEEAPASVHVIPSAGDAAPGEDRVDLDKPARAVDRERHALAAHDSGERGAAIAPARAGMVERSADLGAALAQGHLWGDSTRSTPPRRVDAETAGPDEGERKISGQARARRYCNSPGAPWAQAGRVSGLPNVRPGG